MKEKTYIIMKKRYFFIFFLLSLFAVSILSITIHEYSHYLDFKQANVTTKEICILNLPTNLSNFDLNSGIGYNSFEYDMKNEELVQDINKYTEIKAYAISFIFLLLFLIISFKYKFIKLEDEQIRG